MRRRVGTLELAYDDRGSGPPLILLHAFPFSRRLWDAQVDALAPAFRVVALDLRGHGESDAPLGPYGMGELAEDVLGLADQLGLERFALGGISLGGYVAFEVVRRAAERVAALILSNTRAEADDEASRARREEVARFVEREGAAALATRLLPAPLLGATTRARRPDLADRLGAIVAATSPRAIAATQRAMAARADSIDLLRALDAPMLLVAGDEDEVTPVTLAERMRDAARVAELAVLDGAGHLSCVERPDAWTAVARAFLRRAARDAGW